MGNKEELATKEERVPVPKYANMISGYQGALQIVDDVILKNYVTNLSIMNQLKKGDKSTFSSFFDFCEIKFKGEDNRVCDTSLKKQRPRQEKGRYQ